MTTPLTGIDQRANNRAPAAMHMVLRSYRAELPLDLLDQQGSLLDLRIVAGTRARARTTHQDGDQ